MKTLFITMLLALASAAPQNLTADFKLVRTSPMLQGEQVSLGKFTYNAPDYLRWEYTSPEKAVYEMNGKKDNLSPQVKRLLEMINACIEGGENMHDFKVTRSGKTVTVIPLRREMKRVIERVTVVMGEMENVAESVDIKEPNGGRIFITFYNVKTGK